MGTCKKSTLIVHFNKENSANMHVGLIIVFNHFKDSQLKSDFITSLKALHNIKICLVCNSNDDIVLEQLNEIAYHGDHIAVVSTKRTKSTSSAVKAGARYVYNHYNLKYVGYIADFSSLENFEFVKKFESHQQTIITLIKEEIAAKKVKQTYYQSLFSIPKHLDKVLAMSQKIS